MSASRRILSLWLPYLATDRLRRPGTGGRLSGVRPEVPADRPLVTVAAERGRLTVAAVDPAAEAAGLAPGMPLADARAMVPDLAASDADPEGDAALLGRLAGWARRYTPWTATDGMATDGIATDTAGGDPGAGVSAAAGLILDITGCAHLFGGEEGLLADMAERLRRAGLTGRAAIADTTGAAWAATRFGGPEIVRPGTQEAFLSALPVAALRLPPDTVAALRRVGLRRVGALLEVPRAALAARYGRIVAQRLDQALGLQEEPVNPRGPVPAHIARLAFAEPVSTPDDMARALRQLLHMLCDGLVAAGQGARRLVLAAWRADGGITAPPQLLEAGTSRPGRDPAHLFRLFQPRLDSLAPGAGFEVMTLSAAAAETYVAEQTSLDGAVGDALPVGELVDRLGARLGLDRIRAPVPRESWMPERAVALAPVDPAMLRRAPGGWPPGRPRPVRLLPRPEPVDVIAPVPDDPPLMFRWRGALHRVNHAEGPERIAPEWWLRPGEDDPGEARDYYRVEDTDGRRFWLYRLGLPRPEAPARWYLHGALG